MTEIKPRPLTRICHLPRLRLTPAEFKSLPEYSSSIPTGTTTGKRWKRHDGVFDHAARRAGIEPVWMIGEYGEVSDDGKTILIHWYRPVITVRAASA